jgi:hypothetical protein
MGKAVGIFSIKVGMVAEGHGEVSAVERIKPDAVRVTFADGHRRTINLGGYIYI